MSAVVAVPGTEEIAIDIKKPVPKVPLAAKLVVGAVAGVVGTVCIFPIDMVKTRLQSGSALYTGPISAAKAILKSEGVAGFYRGLGANLAGVTPEKAIKLAANDLLREALELPDGTLPLHREMMAGAGAGLCQVVATNPMEIVKIRMQMQALLPAAERQGTMDVVRGLGVRGMYQGTTATLSRDIPFSLIFFPLYANLKKAFADKTTGENTIPSLLGAGGLAGAMGAWAATPADVIKTRLQLVGGKEKYGDMGNCFRTVVKEEGPTALFKGSVPRMCVVAPLFGIALLSFEMQKDYMIKSGMLG